jgi:copper chaperone CopZ
MQVSGSTLQTTISPCMPKRFQGSAAYARSKKPINDRYQMLCDRRFAAKASVATPEADLVEVELKIEGLMCESCDSRVQSALTGMEGVMDARVSHESGIATIQVDAANLLDAWNLLPKLVEAVDALGFKAEPYLDG